MSAPSLKPLQTLFSNRHVLLPCDLFGELSIWRVPLIKVAKRERHWNQTLVTAAQCWVFETKRKRERWLNSGTKPWEGRGHLSFYLNGCSCFLSQPGSIDQSLYTSLVDNQHLLSCSCRKVGDTRSQDNITCTSTAWTKAASTWTVFSVDCVLSR